MLGNEATMDLSCRRTQTASSRRSQLVTLFRELASAIAVLTVVFAAAVRAEDTNTGAVSQKDVQAKLTYCEVCHGVSAQGFHGYYPIPRLAGQQTEYLKNQLEAFVEHRRTNNIMFNVGHVLSPAMIAALAADFLTLNPRPIGGGPRGLVGAGERIFQNGV